MSIHCGWTRILYMAGVVFFCLSLQPAQAYLDPGTGSMIIQLLIAGVLSALVFFRQIGHGIKTLFAKITGRGKQNNDDH